MNPWTDRQAYPYRNRRKLAFTKKEKSNRRSFTAWDINFIRDETTYFSGSKLTIKTNSLVYIKM